MPFYFHRLGLPKFNLFSVSKLQLEQLLNFGSLDSWFFISPPQPLFKATITFLIDRVKVQYTHNDKLLGTSYWCWGQGGRISCHQSPDTCWQAQWKKTHAHHWIWCLSGKKMVPLCSLDPSIVSPLKWPGNLELRFNQTCLITRRRSLISWGLEHRISDNTLGFNI